MIPIRQLFYSKHVLHSQDGGDAAAEVAVVLVLLCDTSTLSAIARVNLDNARAQPIVLVGAEGKVFG